MGLFYNSKGYCEELRFTGGESNGMIHYKHDIYRVKPEAFEAVNYCTNMKWLVEALEIFAYEKIQSGDYETYFEKIDRKGKSSVLLTMEEGLICRENMIADSKAKKKKSRF